MTAVTEDAKVLRGTQQARAEVPLNHSADPAEWMQSTWRGGAAFRVEIWPQSPCQVRWSWQETCSSRTGQWSVDSWQRIHLQRSNRVAWTPQKSGEGVKKGKKRARRGRGRRG